MSNEIETKTDIQPVVPAAETKVDTTVAPETTSKVSDPADLTAIQKDDKPDDSVSFDDFLAVKDNIPLAQKEVKKEPEVKKDEPALETKPKVEPKKEEIKKEDTKVETTVDDKASKRDYTDVPEEFLPVMKKAHNAAFDTFKPIVKDFADTKKKLSDSEAEVTRLKKGALPDNYYEHQRGYILTPEFENAANVAIKAEMVANHWKNQLERVRKGEPTYQDISIDPRSGEFILSDPMQATKDSENKIAGYVDWAINQQTEKQYAIRSISEKHNVTHKEAVTQIADFESKAFKNFDGEKSKEWEPIIKDTIMKTFPPAYRSNPLARGYAKSLITIQQLGSIIKHLQESGGKESKVEIKDDKVINLDDKRKAGPTNGDMANSGASSSKNDDVTIDDFNAVKNGY